MTGLALLAVLLTLLPQRPPPREVTIMLVYSDDADDILTPLLHRFDRSQPMDGLRIHVVPRVVTSGLAEQQIGTPSLLAAAWIPASSVWPRLMEEESRGGALTPHVGRSLLYSPEVIAIWESIAARLGWSSSRQNIGWKDILNWATHPGKILGAFRFGHTNPASSTSGLYAAISEYYAVTGRGDELQTPDVDASATHRKVRKIESAILHYTKKASDFCGPMATYGPAYVTAVYMQETVLIKCNMSLASTKWGRLAGAFPGDGTFAADYPYVTLEAWWISPIQRQAAETLGRWLRIQITANLANRYGFRPLPNAPAPTRLGAQGQLGHGILQLPRYRGVLSAILRAWKQDRKPTDIMLVAGISPTRSSERAAEVREAVSTFLESVSDRDLVGLIQIGRVDRISDLRGRVGDDRLKRTMGRLKPHPDARLYDAIWTAVRTLKEKGRPKAIHAVVALLDAPDGGSSLSLPDLLRRLRETGITDPHGVRVFVVASGAPNAPALNEIAEASAGKVFEDISGVYDYIASYH